MAQAQVQDNTFVKEFVAGCVAGFSKIYTGQPFDIIKVRLQSAQGDVKPSPLTVVKNLIKYEGGPLALWKGSLPPLLGVGATVSIQFGVNENVKKFISQRNGGKKMSFTELFVSGFLAGFANCIVSTPAEHFRIRIQTQSKDAPLYKGSLDCMKKIYQNNGIRGAYRGLFPTIYRDSFGYGSYFAAYSILMDWLAPGQTRREQSYTKIGVAGSLAGILFWGLVFPFDVIKTKYQTDNLDKPQFKNMKDGFAKIYNAKGLSGFYQGFLPCFLRAIPVNGAVFVMFEVLHRNFIAPPLPQLKAV